MRKARFASGKVLSLARGRYGGRPRPIQYRKGVEDHDEVKLPSYFVKDISFDGFQLFDQA